MNSHSSFYLILTEEDNIRNRYQSRRRSYNPPINTQPRQDSFTSRPNELAQDIEYERAMQTERDLLRQEQESAYLQAQKMAKEMEEAKIREAEQKRLQAEEEERQRIQKAEEKKNKLKTLPEEPENISDNVVTFVIRNPDGDRFVRRFYKENGIQDLYNYVETLEDSGIEGDYDLIRRFPELILAEKKSQTVGEVFGESNQETLNIIEKD